MPASPAALPYVAGLDGLRAFAVLAVLGYHLGAGWLRGGFIGVSVFFTLSGFLIGSLLIRELEGSGRVDLGQFWLRRARRLLPGAWLTLVLVMVLAGVGAWSGSQLRSLGGDVLASLTQVFNWRLVVSGASYESLGRLPSPVQHFWSLAIEEQVYLLLPGLMWGAAAVARRFGGGVRRWWWAAVGVLVLGSLGRSWAAGMASADRAYLGTDTRAFEVGVGTLLALWCARGVVPRRASVRRLAAGISVVSLLTLLVLVVRARVASAWLYPWGLLASSLATTGLVWSAVAWPRSSLWWGSRGLVAVGRRSYALYLVHWPVIWWLRPAAVGFGGWPLLVLRLAVTGLFVEALFRCVEQPVRVRRPRWTRRVGWASVLVAGALIGSSATASALAPEAPDYLKGAARSRLVIRDPIPTSSSTALGSTVPASTVPASTVLVPTTTIPLVAMNRVLLVGDSVARSFSTQFGQALSAAGTANADASVPGCGLVTGVPADSAGRAYAPAKPCNAGVPKLQLRSVATFKPDLVVALSTWESVGRLVDGQYLAAGSAELDAALLRLFGEAVTRLSSPGARVALVRLPDPVAGDEVTPGADEIAQIRHLNELLDQVAAASGGRAFTVAFDRAVCPSDPCPTVVDGIRLRGTDGRHFDTAAAQRWAAFALIALLRSSRVPN